MEITPCITTNTQPVTSNVEKDEHAGGSFVSLFVESKSLPRDALEILLALWRVGTEKSNNPHVKRFVKFCRERYTDFIKATTEMGTEFLTEYFKTGVSYSSVNSVRSALSSIIKPVCNAPFGKSPLVCRFLKGVFNIRPALPRYVTTWDVTKVFTFIKSKPTLTNCFLKTLSHRLAILLFLKTGQRDQTIKCLNLDYIKISSEKVVLFVPETLKTTRPGHHSPYRT